MSNTLRATKVRRAASVTLLLLLLVACAAETLPAGPVIETLAELESALADAGVVVTRAENPSAPELKTVGQGLLVGNVPVQAYEYGSTVERRLVSDTIRVCGYLVSGEPVDWPAPPNIWTAGRLIVVYPGVDGGTVLLLSGLLGDPLTFEAPTIDEPYPPAVLVAIGAAAEATGALPQDVQVISYESQDWPNSCLGLPGPDEMCAEAIVPGWIVRLNVGGTQVVFRVDEVGTELRQE